MRRAVVLPDSATGRGAESWSPYLKGEAVAEILGSVGLTAQGYDSKPHRWWTLLKCGTLIFGS